MTEQETIAAGKGTLGPLVEQYYSPGVKWRTYPNPMRGDGVFVAEDKPVEPYPGVRRLDGSSIYPATPQTRHAIPFQLPHAEAEELVRMLNSALCVKTEAQQRKDNP